jgi:hypothetical protein
MNLHRFRFVINNPGGLISSISTTSILDLLCVGITPVTATRLLDGVKIKKVEAWAANGAGNVSNGMSLEWTDTPILGGPGNISGDIAVGLNDVLHVCVKPPSGSLASQWITSVGAPVTLLEFSLPQGTVFDIELETSLMDTDAPVLVTGVVAGAVAGQVYCRRLDSVTTNLMIPVGWFTI